MPVAGLGDLLGPPGATGFQTVGGTLQSARRGRAGTCSVHGAVVHRAHRMGRAVVLLGQEHCDRPLDRRHGNRSRPNHPAAAGPGASHGMSPSTTKPAVSITMPQPPSGSAMARFLWNFRHHPKRELWFAWWVMVIFYNLYGVLFFLVTRVQPPPSPAWDTPMVVQWFDARHYGILAGFGVVFLISGMCAPMNALLAYSMRRMSVSRIFGYSYLIMYSLSAIPGMLVMAIAMTVGALRPDRDPEQIHWLYDFAFLSFSGTMGVF